jgi:hypothetical protein
MVGTTDLYLLFVCVCVCVCEVCVNSVGLTNRHWRDRPIVPLPNRTLPLPCHMAVNNLYSIELGQSARLRPGANYCDTFLTTSSVAGQRRCGTLRWASHPTSLPTPPSSHRTNPTTIFPRKTLKSNIKELFLCRKTRGGTVLQFSPP